MSLVLINLTVATLSDAKGLKGVAKILCVPDVHVRVP
jgi:hypothetical protein